MFNSSLKKEALRIHEEVYDRYNKSYKSMEKSCEKLYEQRVESIEVVKMVEKVINSIVNTPKEFETKLGEIEKYLNTFKETEEYAEEAYEASVKTGISIAGSAAAGLGVATMVPTAMMSFATTFGSAATGVAIKSLSGAAAQKAAVAWIGRTFAGFAVTGGTAGMAAGQAFLALAGPVGWGITAVSTGASLISLNKKNKEVAAQAMEEAREIAKAREAIDETIEKVNALKKKTEMLCVDIEKQKERIVSFMNADYRKLETEDQYFLGTLVNNTNSLAAVINETIA